jgi:hypothetical protein
VHSFVSRLFDHTGAGRELVEIPSWEIQFGENIRIGQLILFNESRFVIMGQTKQRALKELYDEVGPFDMRQMYTIAKERIEVNLTNSYDSLALRINSISRDIGSIRVEAAVMGYYGPDKSLSLIRVTTSEHWRTRTFRVEADRWATGSQRPDDSRATLSAMIQSQH